MTGLQTGGKPINLAQLQSEMQMAKVAYTSGLGQADSEVFTYDAEGQPADFADQAAAEAVLSAHVAMRDKTDGELAAEFQDPSTTPARKQEIRDMQSGLLPREQVPMDAAA